MQRHEVGSVFRDYRPPLCDRPRKELAVLAALELGVIRSRNDVMATLPKLVG